MKITIRLECSSEQEAMGILKRLKDADDSQLDGRHSLSTRTDNCLTRYFNQMGKKLWNAPRPLEKIAAIPLEELRCIRNFGRTSFRELYKLLETHGISIRNDWKKKKSQTTWK